MSTIIMRSALVFYGHNPAPDVSYVTIDPRYGRQVVTWADVMRQRREEQERRIRRKRACHLPRVHKLWVAYFDQFVMGGWHAFLETLEERIWIDRDRRWLKDELMRLFPSTLPGLEDWHEWKIDFAKSHQRGRHHRRPRGVAFVWFDGFHADTLRRAA